MHVAEVFGCKVGVGGLAVALPGASASAGALGRLNNVTRRLRLLQACIAGLALGSLVAGLSPSRAYRKDLQVEYVSARAWRDGADIFAPVPELSARYFPHPTDEFPDLLVLALVMLGWRAAADGRNERAGLWLGLAAAIKFYPALLLVPLLVRRRVQLVVAAGVAFGLSQLGNLIAAGPLGVFRYYSEVLPSVSGLYMHLGLNSSPYGALLRLFGGAADIPPLVNTPGIVVPLTVVLSAGALLALAKLEPVAAPVAPLVALPSVWFYYVVLALPQIVALLRSPGFRRATLLATAAASVVLPLVNLLAGWVGGKAPPMAALLAVQPAGFVGLLILSLVQPRASGAAAPRNSLLVEDSNQRSAKESTPSFYIPTDG